MTVATTIESRDVSGNQRARHIGERRGGGQEHLVKLDERFAGLGKYLEDVEQARFGWQRGEMCHDVLRSARGCGSRRPPDINSKGSYAAGRPSASLMLQSRETLKSFAALDAFIRYDRAENTGALTKPFAGTPKFLRRKVGRAAFPCEPVSPGARTRIARGSPIAQYMDSPCVASASSLVDSGSDCRQYIRPLEPSVDASPPDIRSQEPCHFHGVLA